ncbi:MAG TPA: type I-E CRISPR-associated protein Cas7/Cse4/CasC [Mycobacterium sp.]
MTVVDIHILQTVPPSNINRDDTGSPKTANFGGTRRARVSSQAWKRATRKAFAGLVDTRDLGVRTKQVVELIGDEIVLMSAETSQQDAHALAEKVLEAAGIKLVAPRKKKGEQEGTHESGYLVFLARHQIENLAALALSSDGAVDKKAAKSAVNSANSVDVAAFGRMVADDAELNVDAAVQVAHAISVHKVDNEFDYFTAVDDRKAAADETGAGMIGTVEFNSSTLYRYATVNVDGLRDNLGGEAPAARALRAFVDAFVTSMPTGKQNTFANRTLPDAVVVQVRSTQPVNLVGAFEEAVVAEGGRGRLAVAAERLVSHALRIDTAYGTAPEASFVVSANAATSAVEALGDVVSLTGLLDGVVESVAARREPA